MFMLYALLIGLIAGLLVGGRLAGLADLHFRWVPVFVLGLMAQLILFSDAVADRIGDLGAPIYVASTAAVLVALAGNARITGIPIVALGATFNFLAIIANGGYMPAGGAAMEALDKSLGNAYSNSAVLAHPALEPLTDVFSLPAWVPYANIFSIGDVLISLGVVVVIAVAMRRGRGGAPAHIPGLEQPV